MPPARLPWRPPSAPALEGAGRVSKNSFRQLVLLESSDTLLGGGEPRLCCDGGGAEDGAHTAFGLGRAAAQDVRPGGVRVLEVWRKAGGVGVREGSRRGESECGALGVAPGECAPGPCARDAPEGVVLKLKPPQPAKRARHLPRPCWESGWAGRRVSAGDERLLRRLGVRLRGSPSASLTSRSAPARYAQAGSCPSYAPRCQGSSRWTRPGVPQDGSAQAQRHWSVGN